MRARGITPWGLSLLLHLVLCGVLLGGAFWTQEARPSPVSAAEVTVVTVPMVEEQGQEEVAGAKILEEVRAAPPRVMPELPAWTFSEGWPLSGAVPTVAEGVAPMPLGPAAEMGVPRVVLPPRLATAAVANKPSGGNVGGWTVGDGGKGAVSKGSGKGDHGNGTGDEDGGYGVMTDGKVGMPVPLVGNVQPEYPAEALKLKQQGQVRVGLTIGRDGRVGNVVLLQSSGFVLLDEAAVNTVKQWQFKGGASDIAAEQVITFAMYGK